MLESWQRNRGFFSNQKIKGHAQWGNLRRKEDPDTEVSQGDVQDHADILDLLSGKILKNRNQVKQFVVMCVREPAADGYRVLGVKDVGGWGIINNDSLSKVSANLRKILLKVRNDDHLG